MISPIKGLILIPIENLNKHNYTLGLPVGIDETGISSRLYRIDFPDERGNSLFMNKNCFRKPTPIEMLSYTIIKSNYRTPK